MSFKRSILELANSISTQEFTVEDIRKLVQEDFPRLKASDLHAKTYKAMWVLKKEGFFTCEPSGEGRRLKKWTLTSKACSVIESTSPEAQVSNVSHQEGMTDLISYLKGRLSDFSAQLAILSAEVQQYHDLSKEFPNLSPKLNTIFQEAKQKAVVYQGRMRAIENTLSEIER